MMNQSILKIENYIFNLFKDNLSLDYTYHNFMHTAKVVEAIKKLISNENIEVDNAEKLIIAGWFHDAGYIKSIKNHEEESIKIASTYLKNANFSDEYIDDIKKLILATDIEYTPENIDECIIKDADNFHLAQKDYFKISELLRDEISITCDKIFSDYEWNLENRNYFLNVHRYFTNSAKELWLKRKEDNLITIQNNIKEFDISQEISNKIEVKKKKNNKEEKPNRGIDTLFRVTLNNHTRLSDIADSKANILLSVNAIIISIALSTLVPKLANPVNKHLLLPAIVMLIFSVISIIFAIMATKPNVTYNEFKDEDLKNRKVNLLFFGNFYQMEIEKYEEAMKELMEDREYLYNSLTRDLYFLGKVLERKYRLLSITYTIFMIGTILSVLTFAIALFTNVF